MKERPIIKSKPRVPIRYNDTDDAIFIIIMMFTVAPKLWQLLRKVRYVPPTSVSEILLKNPE